MSQKQGSSILVFWYFYLAFFQCELQPLKDSKFQIPAFLAILCINLKNLDKIQFGDLLQFLLPILLLNFVSEFVPDFCS